MNLQKCAVIGCGAVGATTAYTLLGSGLFSELVLLDIDQKKAEGEAMDIAHGVPFVRPVNVYAGDYPDLADAGLVIITAGAAQSPGETRIDLVRKNVKIFRSIVPQIVRCNRDAILLVVANPVDILTYVTLKLSGFPASRVIGSGTVLDTARFKYLLGEHLEVDPRNIHAFIIGEHGDTELPVWSSANVSGIDLADFCKVCGKCADMAGCTASTRRSRTAPTGSSSARARPTTRSPKRCGGSRRRSCGTRTRCCPFRGWRTGITGCMTSASACRRSSAERGSSRSSTSRSTRRSTGRWRRPRRRFPTCWRRLSRISTLIL